MKYLRTYRSESYCSLLGEMYRGTNSEWPYLVNASSGFAVKALPFKTKNFRLSEMRFKTTFRQHLLNGVKEKLRSAQYLLEISRAKGAGDLSKAKVLLIGRQRHRESAHYFLFIVEEKVF